MRKMVASGTGKIREKEMKEQVLISVIVPVYAAEKYLERCVNSLTGQTWKNLEILLIDDGAKDRSPQMCDEFAEKDKRIRVIHKENGGLMSAWMRGVKESTGEYLCFVDSDDWIDKEMIEGLMAAASDCQAEVLCGNYVQEEKNRSIPVIQPLKPGVYEGDALRDKVFGRLVGEEKRPITLSRCMKLFSRKLIEDNMHFCDPSIVMGEDMNITLPALLDIPIVKSGTEGKLVPVGTGPYYYAQDDGGPCLLATDPTPENSDLQVDLTFHYADTYLPDGSQTTGTISLSLPRNGQKLTVVTNNYTVTTVKIKENRIIDVPRDFSDVTIDPSWDGESTTDGN